MIRTAPIRYTAHPEQWGRVLRALGCTVIQNEPGWAVYAVGAGILRLHGPVEGQPLGTTELWLQTDDAHAAASRLAGEDGSVTEHPLVEPSTMGWDVTFPDGRFAGVEPLTPREVPQLTNRLSVQPLWLTNDPQGAANDLMALGATRILRSDSGGWANLSTDDGLVATHEGRPAAARRSGSVSGSKTSTATKRGDPGSVTLHPGHR